MKKTISTILALVILAMPLEGTLCFADEHTDNVGAYVQNQELSEQYKLNKKTLVKAGKIAGCVAAGTAATIAVVGSVCYYGIPALIVLLCRVKEIN